MITGFMLPFDALEEYAGLTNEQFGNLIRAGLIFARDGKETELQPPESYLYPGLKLKIERDKAKYLEKCRTNRANINHRWGNSLSGDDTTVYDRIRPYTNDTNININPNNQLQSQSINHQSQEQARNQLVSEGYTETEVDQAIARAGNGQPIRNLTKYVRQSIENARQEPKRTNKSQEYTQREYDEREETPEEMIQRLNAEGV